jgi:hypothetical protein
MQSKGGPRAPRAPAKHRGGVEPRKRTAPRRARGRSLGHLLSSHSSSSLSLGWFAGLLSEWRCAAETRTATGAAATASRSRRHVATQLHRSSAAGTCARMQERTWRVGAWGGGGCIADRCSCCCGCRAGPTRRPPRRPRPPTPSRRRTHLLGCFMHEVGGYEQIGFELPPDAWRARHELKRRGSQGPHPPPGGGWAGACFTAQPGRRTNRGERTLCM